MYIPSTGSIALGGDGALGDNLGGTLVLSLGLNSALGHDGGDGGDGGAIGGGGGLRGGGALRLGHGGTLALSLGLGMPF